MVAALRGFVNTAVLGLRLNRCHSGRLIETPLLLGRTGRMNLNAVFGIVHLTVLMLAIGLSAAEPVYPVRVSANGRYVIDQRGQPVFWLGTTQWQLFREYNLEEAQLNPIRVNERDTSGMK